MNIVIFLTSDIDAFNVTEKHIKPLSDRFTSWNFTMALNEEDFLKFLPDANVVITWKFEKSWYKKAQNLKMICTPSAGHDWIEREEEPLIPIFHGSFHGPIIAESLMSMILYFNRRIHQTITNQKKHIWDRDFLSCTRTLSSQHIVIVGYGKIARECARVLKVFGCRITGVKHSPYDYRLDKDADEICHPDNISKVLQRCDHLIAILPNDKSNERFFSKELFSFLKPGGYFYNVGRGNSSLEQDVIWALDKKIISGAGLDVFPTEPLANDSLLWDHPNVLIMPHGTAIFQDYIPVYFNELTEILKAFR